ncbi:MAG: hypothetical protein KC441_03955 [Anaerolineales bacterium]|nr:hypothetical protein [Anaerolineales bacterium]MCB8987693.1 hypothetical protein [Ardenticatenaceae bacterium]
MNDTLGLVIGFTLTLLIYSFVIGDNPVYRLAVHILVGVSAAYAGVYVLRQVILPVFAQLAINPISLNSLLWLVPILLALLLILQRISRLSWLGDNATALLVGVGAAVALVGAISGTLLPQVMTFYGRGNAALTPLEGLIVAVLTICTLLTFHFTGKRNEQGEWIRPFWQRGLVQLGQAVLMITFGALFAGILSTSLILLTERISYYFMQFTQLLP